MRKRNKESIFRVLLVKRKTCTLVFLFHDKSLLNKYFEATFLWKKSFVKIYYNGMKKNLRENQISIALNTGIKLSSLIATIIYCACDMYPQKILQSTEKRIFEFRLLFLDYLNIFSFDFWLFSWILIGLIFWNFFFHAIFIIIKFQTLS